MTFENGFLAQGKSMEVNLILTTSLNDVASVDEFCNTLIQAGVPIAERKAAEKTVIAARGISGGTTNAVIGAPPTSAIGAPVGGISTVGGIGIGIAIGSIVGVVFKEMVSSEIVLKMGIPALTALAGLLTTWLAESGRKVVMQFRDGEKERKIEADSPELVQQLLGMILDYEKQHSGGSTRTGGAPSSLLTVAETQAVLTTDSSTTKVKPQGPLQIFLCHSSDDKPKVRELYRRLGQAGFAPWLDDEKLLGGQDWQEEISRAVRSSDVVLVCLSKASVTKDGFVNREIKFALDLADEKVAGKIFIIPARLEEIEVPERLKRWHWINLFEESGYQNLLRALTLRSRACEIGTASSKPAPEVSNQNQQNTFPPVMLRSQTGLFSQIRIIQTGSAKILSVAVNPDGHRVLSATEGATSEMLKVWDLESGQELRMLQGHSGWVHGIAVTPDGRRAVSASGDKTLKVWDLESGRELLTLQGHSRSVYGTAVTPDGLCAVSASCDETLKLWDLESGQELRTFRSHSKPVTSVQVTPEGRRVVSASYDGTLKVWDLASAQLLSTCRGHSGFINHVTVTADARYAVSASDDHTLKVWDLGTGQELRVLQGHSSKIFCVAASPDSRRALSGSLDRTVKMWDLESGLEVGTFTCQQAACCCAFLDNTTTVVCDAGGRIYVLKVATSSN
jgi:WD40 repeat protein